jgi:putative ABC transport system permease protein
LLARNVFQLDLQPGLWLFPQAISFGVLLSVGIGWLAVRRLLATPPLLALRAGA